MIKMKNMNEKSVKSASRKIENKITLVTSILGMIIVNIIWIAGIKNNNELSQPAFTQNKIKNDTPKVDITNIPLAVSMHKTSLN